MALAALALVVFGAYDSYPLKGVLVRFFNLQFGIISFVDSVEELLALALLMGVWRQQSTWSHDATRLPVADWARLAPAVKIQHSSKTI